MPTVRYSEFQATLLTLRCELKLSRDNESFAPNDTRDFLNSQMNQLVGALQAAREGDLIHAVSKLCGEISVQCDKYGGARVGRVGTEMIEVEWRNQPINADAALEDVLSQVGAVFLGEAVGQFRLFFGNEHRIIIRGVT